MKGPEQPWTDEHVHIARRMAANGFNYSEIALKLGRTNGGVRSYFRRMGLKLNHTLVAVHREDRKFRKVTAHIAERIDEPTQLMLERDARLNEYRDLTQVLMGDPVPSRSALARAQSSVGSTAGVAEDNAQPVGA